MSDKVTALVPVLVEWVDATRSSTGWASQARLAKEALKPIRSTGFLLQETETLVTIVMSQEGDRAADTLLIPRGCVVRIQKLRIE